MVIFGRADNKAKLTPLISHEGQFDNVHAL